MEQQLLKNKNLEKLSLLTTEEKIAILEFAKLLKEKFGPMIREIILFGSKIRGNSNKESDIDVLIVLTRLSWEIKKTISELSAQVNIKYNVLISTIRYDVNAWENPFIESSPFVRTVKKEGIWL